MNTSASASSSARLSNRRRSLSLTLAASVLAIFAWFGSQRASMGPAEGVQLSGNVPGETSIERRKFRVGTFNIHGGRGADGKLDLARIAACIKDSNFVALQETRNEFPWGSDNQAEILGGQLQRGWLFAPAEQRWWAQQFGNGLITDMRVSYWQRVPLVRQQAKSYRNAVLAVVDAGSRKVQVICTHLVRGSAADRAIQLRMVAHWFLAIEPPVLLLGDLNATRNDPGMKSLLATAGVVDALAKAPQDDPRRIDWILARGLDVIAAGMVERKASDHPYYWADVQVIE